MKRKPRSLHKYLGTEDGHTVFKTVLVGVVMGTHMANEPHVAERGIAIWLENQAAISTTTTEKQTAGQYPVNELQKELVRVASQSGGTCITLRWIPCRKGNVDNERADEEAQREQRAGNLAMYTRELPKSLKTDLPPSKAAALQKQCEKFDKENAETYLASKERPD